MTKHELEQCISKYGSDIYSFCLHLTGNRQQADELYQETFLRAVEKQAEIDAEGNVKSYLLSVAVRLWRNWKRKAAWRSRIAAVVLGAEPEDGHCAGRRRHRTWLPWQEDGVESQGVVPDGGSPKTGIYGVGIPEEDYIPTPEQIILDREKARAVRDAVDCLPEKLRIVILLCYMEDCTVSRTAEILNIPEGTVKSRLYQARKRLEKELESVLNE